MQDELSFIDIAENAGALPALPDGGDLWPRIASAHAARRRRRRTRRIVGGLSAVCLAAALAVGLRPPSDTSAVDWQARAQALELQLDETMGASRSDRILTTTTADELVQIDRALQAAYDRGAGKSELLPLWKQRSELLSVMLAVRQQQLALTRI